MIFLLLSHQTNYFSFKFMYFDLESKSDVHFLQPEPKTLHNTEKTKFPGLSRVSGGGRPKWIPDFDSTCLKNLNSKSSIQKIQRK